MNRAHRIGALLAIAGLALAGCSTPDAPTPSGSSSTTGQTPTTPPALPWGPTQAQVDEATATVSAWSPEQLAGQVLILTYPGTDPAAAARGVTSLHAGGVILMGDNIASADQVRATADAVQAAAKADGRDFPAIVAVDQEGGLVARLGKVSPETPTFMSAGAAIAGSPQTGPAVVQNAALASGQYLRGLGFTWVFAPDADVTSGRSDPTIGTRSASDDPVLVSQAVTAALAGYDAAHIVASVKHYPGHGSVPADSHTELPVQQADLATLKARDIVPFQTATQDGVPVVMMSHIAAEAFEAGVPSSLSPAAYASLRSDVGFEGVVVTDALNMQAITDGYGAGPAAAKAVIAGADAVLMPADGAQAHAAIVAALADGSLPRERLVEAAARVVAVQTWEASRGASPQAGVDLAQASQALSAAAITQVGGQCTTLLTDSVQVSGGNADDRARFTEAAQAAGLSVGSGPMVKLLTSRGGEGDIVVALDSPLALEGSSGLLGAFAVYGRTPGAYAALLDVLTGKAKPAGALPMAVGDLTTVRC